MTPGIAGRTCASRTAIKIPIRCPAWHDRAMPNWAPLHAAILRDVPNARRLALIQQAETWLGLPLETALKACAGAAPDEATAREVNAALGLVMAAQRRDLGMPDGPAGIPRFQELAAAYQAGTLEPALRRTWERGGIAFQLWMAQRETFPAIASPPPPLPDEPALRATLAALQERQFAAQQYAVPGGATPARMDALEAVLSDYRGLAATVAAGRQVHTDICFFAGHTAYALARGWWILGRIQRAAQLYAEAAGFYEQAAQPADAADASEKARSLGYAVRSDIDGASVQDLRALVAGDTGPLIRARAHARLALLAAAANDVFDAAEWAEKAAGNLVEAGFPDPEAQPMDTVLDAWITTACRTASEPGAPAAFRLLTEIGQAWQSLLGARQARWVAPDPARAERTTAALAALNVALRQVAEQPAVANETVEAGLKRYFPLPFLPKRVEDEENADLPERMQAVADRLNAIKIEANAAEAAGNSAAFPDLLRRCAACVADARAMAIGATIGLACQIDAYVRLRAGDAPGSAAAAADGEAAILDGMPATPETMAGHPEFGLLLMLRGVRLQALGCRTTRQGWSRSPRTACRLSRRSVTASAIPTSKARSSPSARFLRNGRVRIVQAWPLGRVAVGHGAPIKARAALLNRLSPPPAAPDADLARRLDAANAALATAPEGSDARLAAAEQRRLLLSLRAIERARQGKPDAVPTLSVAAVQAALAPDEAVIAWVWIARRVLIVMALDAARVHVERVVLSDAGPRLAGRLRHGGADGAREHACARQHRDPAGRGGAAAGHAGVRCGSAAADPVAASCAAPVAVPCREAGRQLPDREGGDPLRAQSRQPAGALAEPGRGRRTNRCRHNRHRRNNCRGGRRAGARRRHLQRPGRDLGRPRQCGSGGAGRSGRLGVAGPAGRCHDRRRGERRRIPRPWPTAPGLSLSAPGNARQQRIRHRGSERSVRLPAHSSGRRVGCVDRRPASGQCGGRGAERLPFGTAGARRPRPGGTAGR